MRKTLNKYCRTLKSDQILEEEDFDIENLKETYEENFRERSFYLHGCWTGINKYIDEMEILKKDLRFPEFTESANRRMRESMERTESVSVHIRRGDYVGTVFDVLTLDYYKKAIEYIMQTVQSPYFYFFSDDVNYIEENFNFLDNKEIINWNRGKNSWRDMQLMACCRHNIIANSTFSQWGALLNGNPDKIVLYPGREKRFGKWKM